MVKMFENWKTENYQPKFPKFLAIIEVVFLFKGPSVLSPALC